VADRRVAAKVVEIETLVEVPSGPPRLAFPHSGPRKFRPGPQAFGELLRGMRREFTGTASMIFRLPGGELLVHREAEGSSYYRHFIWIAARGWRAQTRIGAFAAEADVMGCVNGFISRHRLDDAVAWMRR